MLALVWLLMMMKSEAVEVITVRSGESVLLTSKLLKSAKAEHRQDIRWTHQHLVMSLKNNKTVCYHKRCAMQSNGTLMFTHVQSADAGDYRLEVFNSEGQRLVEEDFLLRVEGAGLSQGGSIKLVCVLIITLVLLVPIVIFYVCRKRQVQRTMTAGPLEENVYVVMNGNKSKAKDVEDEKHENEEESPYVLCPPRLVVSMETLITDQKTLDEEDIYV
ncbi:uncharacterized protein LOC117813310 [Notolabrus celidotus]|uniref:uncharacterized protein LOC117813310 n=1 Tax=Notolabrus celidotus TaxID=1203425 RepID=UPI00148FBC7E|nr:uncharacterized protein LOC117813310 [Notolabrus celidotus]